MNATKDLIAEHNAVLAALQILGKIEDGLLQLFSHTGKWCYFWISEFTPFPVLM
jgi:hypothetical protein